MHKAELLRQMARLVEAASTPDELLTAASGAIAEALAAQVIVIWLFDPSTGLLIPYPHSIHGLASDTELPRYPLGVPDMIASAYRTRQAFVSADLAAVDQLSDRNLIELLQVSSVLIMPLGSHQQHSGVLLVGRNQPLAFSDDERALVEATAEQIGLGMAYVQLTAHGRRQAELIRLISQIGGELTADLNPDRLYVWAAARIRQKLGYGMVQVFTHDGSHLTLMAMASDEADSIENNFRFPTTRGIAGRVARTGQSAITRDLSLDPDYYLFAPQQMERFRSALTVPIRSGERVAGVLQVLNRSVGAFDETDLLVLETLAAQIGAAVENARLYDQAYKRFQEQSIVLQIGNDLGSIRDVRGLTEAIVYQLAHAQQTSACCLWFYDSDKGTLTLQSSYVSAQAARPDALRDLPETLFVKDYPSLLLALHMRYPLSIGTEASGDQSPEAELLRRLGQRTALVMPLIAADHPLGLLGWMEDRETRRFTEADLRLAQTLVNQAAIELERTRLQESARRQLRREIILRRMAEAANTWVDRTTLLQQSVQEVRRALQASRCAIYLHREGILHPEADVCDPDVLEPPPWLGPINLEGYPTMRAALNLGELLHVAEEVPNVEQEQARLMQMGYTRAVLAPLICRERLVGALEVLDDRRGHIFTSDDISLVAALANQLSIALDNAMMVEMLNQRAEELARANRLKSEFVANISHELRTPMHSIMGFTDALLSRLYGTLTEKQEDRLQKVKRNAQQLLALIDDLLDLSKIEAGRLELHYQAVDAVQELGAVIASIEPQIIEKGLTIQQEIAEELPCVWADGQRLRQIFTNLLSNAVKFTDTGGIRVRARTDERGQKAFVHFEFVDTGIGIAPKDQVIIFDEFRQADGSETRKYGGTGLGLAITRKLLTMMQGDIWVESETGKGSTFHVLVPVAVGTCESE